MKDVVMSHRSVAVVSRLFVFRDIIIVICLVLLFSPIIPLFRYFPPLPFAILIHMLSTYELRVGLLASGF